MLYLCDAVKVVCPVPCLSYHSDVASAAAITLDGGCRHLLSPLWAGTSSPASSRPSASLLVAMTMVTKPVWDCAVSLITVCLTLLPTHCWKEWRAAARCTERTVPTTCLLLVCFPLYCSQIGPHQWVKQQSHPWMRLRLQRPGCGGWSFAAVGLCQEDDEVSRFPVLSGGTSGPVWCQLPLMSLWVSLALSA